MEVSETIIKLFIKYCEITKCTCDHLEPWSVAVSVGCLCIWVLYTQKKI